ncbi:D-alanyl-D-alanine endopeptidase [Azovibrio restrictus]|uniref:D-alanyl-D-alanine endopeptidase n=1 Tax=Azovibrio restrictus TaxID=146938 RepID=UPI0026EDFBF9|nr:D-alanyl-D-alanine endopeptidase [Azovibrio restrictus]
MKKFTITLLVCALTALGTGAGAIAAEQRQSGKTAAAQKQQAKKTAARKAPAAKSAAKPGKKPVQAARPAARKQQFAASQSQVRKVSSPSDDWTGGNPALGSASVLVLDQHSGTPLLEKNAGLVVPIASISKLMTAMVVLDAGLDLNEVISITDEDVDYLKGTRSRLQVGSAMTRDTALLLALMSSENRAANALGRNFPGGLRAFVAAMNRKALALGMTHTRFEEPTGLSANNVSTARDLARMVAAAHQYPKIREYSTMAEARVDLGHRILDFTNTNALVKNPEWQIGLSKTGYISEAGRCLVMQTWVADRPVVMVLLDSNGKMTRVGDANRIKRWMESAGVGYRNTGA